jgi:protoheme IX farnesyltransferase
MLQQATVQPGVAVQFWRLTKPRVVSLIVFTAVIGMLLAAPAIPPAGLLLAATAGIALVAGAAAAFNCLVEQRIDAAMARTRGRPTVIGTITDAQVLLFSGVVGGWASRSCGTR